MKEVEKKVVLELTRDEANQLFGFLELSLKMIDIKTAKVAVALADKLMESAQVFKETQGE